MRMSLYAGLSAGGLVFLAAGSLLWLRYGERVYFDKLTATLAGCF